MKLNSGPSVQMLIFIFFLFLRLYSRFCVFALLISSFYKHKCVCVHECVSCATLNWREAADLVERPAMAEEGCA